MAGQRAKLKPIYIGRRHARSQLSSRLSPPRNHSKSVEAAGGIGAKIDHQAIQQKLSAFVCTCTDDDDDDNLIGFPPMADASKF